VWTRFRYGSASETLNLAAEHNSPAHSAKGTPSDCPPKGYSPPTACKRTVSGSLSLPSPGCFSPFPHGTGCAIGSKEYLALPGGPGRFAQGSTYPVLLGIPTRRSTFRIRGSHPLWRAVPDTSAKRNCSLMSVPRPQLGMPSWFRLFPVRSPLLRESRSISLPLGTEMFQFPRFPPHRLWVQRWVTTHSVAGFSHSGICGSTPVCGSSQLIAAYHALHRLLAPRHPPCALSSLPTLARFSMTPVQLSKWKSLGPLPVLWAPYQPNHQRLVRR